MIIIDDILIDNRITETNFQCDLEKCKGACCTYPGETGAPVLDEEVPKIEEAYKYAKEYLSEKSIKYIEEHGLLEGEKGEYTTVCINKKDCVFVHYKGDIAYCSIQSAYQDGKIDFIKPVSCHLFPIRIKNFGGPMLYYEKIKECNSALLKGSKTNMKIFNLAKDSLIRRFGEKWYNKLENLISNDL